MKKQSNIKALTIKKVHIAKLNLRIIKGGDPGGQSGAVGIGSCTCPPTLRPTRIDNEIMTD